jgi:uncharacterized membrane protein YccC
MRVRRVHVNDPGLFALKRAARAAIVMPAVFAFADRVIGQPDTTLFAAFGSFAVLVLTDFGGAPRKRLVAYLGLAAAGALLITVGTLCSRTPALAVAAMFLVGFAVLFSGAISGYFAAARIGTLLTFILPVAIPGPASAIPERLEGWALAASVGIAASMLIWPAHPRDRLRAGAARGTRALADLLDSEISETESEISRREEAAVAAIRDLRRSFVTTEYRPTGPTGATEALAFLVDQLDWLFSFVSPRSAGAEPVAEPCRAENLQVLAAAVAVLRSSAETLEGRHEQPDLGRLERAGETAARTLVRRLDDLNADREPERLEAALDPSFRMREIAYGVQEVAVNALVASDATISLPEASRPSIAEDIPGRSGATDRAVHALRETARLLRAHLTPGSAWFRDSLRGAVGLAAAVLVIEMANPQHSFWVVLATLSVLRSNALGTGSTVLWALTGTAAGILVGGGLVVLLGSEHGALWAALPPAVLLAAYAPRAISFAAGQAGFTVVVMIIFNLIAPAGWQAGLVRVEDVAIGCGISLIVGILFWPRGARGLLLRSLGDAYSHAIEYAASAAERLAGVSRQGDDLESSMPAARASARGASDRLDGAVRDFLTESPERDEFDGIATLVAGAVKVRLEAYSLFTLTAAPGDTGPFARCADALEAELSELRAWYGGLAAALVAEKPVAALGAAPARDGGLERCVGAVLADSNGAALGPALNLLWASQHISYLRRLGARLAEPATQLSTQ